MQTNINSFHLGQLNNRTDLVKLVKCYQRQAELLQQTITQQLATISQTKSKIKTVLTLQINSLRNFHHQFKQDIQEKWFLFESEVKSTIEKICIQFYRQIIHVQQQKILWKSRCHQLQKELIQKRSQEDNILTAKKKQKKQMRVLSLPCVQQQSLEITRRQQNVFEFTTRNSLKSQRIKLNPITKQTPDSQLSTFTFQIPKQLNNQFIQYQQQTKLTNVSSILQKRVIQHTIYSPTNSECLISNRSLRYLNSSILLKQHQKNLQNYLNTDSKKYISVDSKEQIKHECQNDKLNIAANRINLKKIDENQNLSKKTNILQNKNQVKAPFKILKDTRVISQHIHNRNHNNVNKYKEILYKTKKYL